jgi:hypothetical protein
MSRKDHCSPPPASGPRLPAASTASNSVAIPATGAKEISARIVPIFHGKCAPRQIAWVRPLAAKQDLHNIDLLYDSLCHIDLIDIWV